MGGGSSGGSNDAIQQEQLKIAKEQLELSKSSVSEPAKAANSSIKGASTAAARAAALRRGISSTFVRSAINPSVSAPVGGSTSGTTAKLGG